MGETEALLGPGGVLASTLPGYESRPSQLEMARAVERVLAHDGVLIVEAGTGTGKTLAYLVPALLSGKKVIVSTGTKTLQDQIMQQDVPLLRAMLGEEISVACMKGLANYLCLRRYDEYRHGAGAAGGASARQLPVIEAWRQGTVVGDRAELADLSSSSSIWADVASGSDTRIGPKCRHYDACYVTKMRRAAEAAQLVVVNHHLFFADLALRGAHEGAALPEYDAVIFDEAHLIEDVATQFFGVAVSTGRVEVLVRDAERALAYAGLAAESARLLSDVARAGANFFAQLPRQDGPDGGRLPLDPQTFEHRVRDPMFALDNALDGLASFCKRKAAEGEGVAQVARRADDVRDDVATIADGGAGSQVSWTQARGRGVTIGASPIEVGEILREKLFQRRPGLVLTSATLSASGSFSFVKQRLGIDFEVDEAILPSPFEYADQAALYLPTDLPDPRDQQYAAAAADRIEQLVELTAGGAFVLCTSRRMMSAIAKHCRPRLDFAVFVQGEAPNHELLERFRSDGNAVLIATASFWQGVDVPGSALRLVIIDKLPFDVPTDPLVEARCERLKQAGEQPFMKYLVPSAALALKQGFGRLIRSRSDRGIVAILDGRVSTKGYGKVFLRSLPPATRCQTLDELARFWSRS